MIREVKLLHDETMNSSLIRFDCEEIPQIFIAPRGFEALELFFAFLGNKRDIEAVVCYI